MKDRLLYRQLSVIILCLLWMLPLLSPIIHNIRKGIHHLEMWEYEGEENLQTLKIEASSLEWVKPNKEVLVNGRYFDVKQVTYQNGQALLTGYFDEKEDLMEAIFGLQKNKQNTTTQPYRQLMVWLSLWHPTHLPGLPDCICLISSNQLLLFNTDPLEISVAGPPAPPPRFFFFGLGHLQKPQILRYSNFITSAFTAEA